MPTQSFQAENISPEEAARQGQTSAARLDELWDYNAALGGRIVTDRLWFFTSFRHWAYNNFAANAVLPDGSQAVDTNRLQAYNLRLTGQLTQKHRLTAMYDRFPKWRGRRNIETGTYEPEATYIQRVPLPYNAQAKWSAPLTSRLYAEAGWSTNFYNYWLGYQDGLEPTAIEPAWRHFQGRPQHEPHVRCGAQRLQFVLRQGLPRLVGELRHRLSLHQGRASSSVRAG